MITRGERMLNDRPHPSPLPSDGRGDNGRQPANSRMDVRRIPNLDNPAGGERFSLCHRHQMGEGRSEGELNH